MASWRSPLILWSGSGWHRCVRSLDERSATWPRWVAVVGTDRTASGDRNGLGIGLEAALEPLPAVVDQVSALVGGWGEPLARRPGGSGGGGGGWLGGGPPHRGPPG